MLEKRTSSLELYMSYKGALKTVAGTPQTSLMFQFNAYLSDEVRTFMLYSLICLSLAFLIIFYQCFIDL